MSATVVTQQLVESCRRKVESADAHFLGLVGGLVWFRDPQTENVLTLPLDQLTVTAVRAKIAAYASAAGVSGEKLSLSGRLRRLLDTDAGDLSSC